MTSDEELIRHIYDRFNARDIDAVLATLAENAAWANGMEGTHIYGPAALREYWTYQWNMIDPHVEPLAVRAREDGAFVVTVHQVVRDLAGALMLDETIEHVFRVEDGRIARFDIQGDSRLSAVSRSSKAAS